MKVVFSNTSYFLKNQIYVCFTYHTSFLGGVLTPLKNLKILKGKCFYNYLKFCPIMPQKSNFRIVLWINGLVSWKTCNLNMILR